MHQSGPVAFLKGAEGLVEGRLIGCFPCKIFHAGVWPIHYMDLRYLLMWKAILIMPKPSESVSLSPRSLNGSTVKPHLSYQCREIVGIETHSPNLQIRSKGTELYSCTPTDLLTLTLPPPPKMLFPLLFLDVFQISSWIHHSQAPLTPSSGTGLVCNALQKNTQFFHTWPSQCFMWAACQMHTSVHVMAQF